MEADWWTPVLRRASAPAVSVEEEDEEMDRVVDARAAQSLRTGCECWGMGMKLTGGRGGAPGLARRQTSTPTNS